MRVTVATEHNHHQHQPYQAKGNPDKVESMQSLPVWSLMAPKNTLGIRQSNLL